MDFDIKKSIEILRQTPSVMEKLLKGLSDEWIFSTEGENTWSAYDIMGHLIHGEKTDWVPRLQIILDESGDKKFKPFDRFAQFSESKGKNIDMLLSEFKQLRSDNLLTLLSLDLKNSQYEMQGIHPAFGKVSLSELLATWVVHDLNHIAQIARVMSVQYLKAVGPWKEYLGILNWKAENVKEKAKIIENTSLMTSTA
ncbi:MAG TPA: DinB family protein [Puia sp.]|nr:DinB family protein [Puia sp.]